MPEQMRKDGTLVEGGLLHGGALGQFLDLAEGSETSHRLSVTVWQERHWGRQTIFANPLAEQPPGLAPQRERELLAPFTLKLHLLGLRAQHVLNPEGEQFRNAGAGVVEQQD